MSSLLRIYDGIDMNTRRLLLAISVILFPFLISAAACDGLDRVILQENIVNGVNSLTQDMFYKDVAGDRVPNTNTEFVILYDFTLSEDITIPSGCVLKFDGGCVSGKTLTFDNTEIVGDNHFFIGSGIKGTIKNSEILIDWFIHDWNDCTTVFNNVISLLESSNGGVIKLSHHVYNVSKIYLGIKTSIVGVGYGSSIIKAIEGSGNSYLTTEKGVVVVSSIGSQDGILNIPTYANCLTIRDLSIVGDGHTSSVNGSEEYHNSTISGIVVANTYGLSSNTMRSSYKQSENATDVEDHGLVASYKNLNIYNVYIGKCMNGVYIERHGFRVNIHDCDIKYNDGYGIYCEGTDNIFYDLYLESNGLSGVLIGPSCKISNTKSIFNGNRDPKNSYAYLLTNTCCALNCESQDNACNGFKIGDGCFLSNCYSSRDCISNTNKSHYSEDLQLVGFRVTGINNVVVNCGIRPYSNKFRTYWKAYEVKDIRNKVDIEVNTNQLFNVNPVDTYLTEANDLGTIERLNYDLSGIYFTRHYRTIFGKNIVLPGTFYVVTDVNIGDLMQLSSETPGNYPCIWDLNGLKLQITYKPDTDYIDVTLTANKITNNGNKLLIVRHINKDGIDLKKDIRIMSLVDAHNKKVYLIVSYIYIQNEIIDGEIYEERYEATDYGGSGQFDRMTPIDITRIALADNYTYTGGVGDLKIKRFVIGSGNVNPHTISKLGSSLIFPATYISFDYNNHIELSGSSLVTNGNVRPSNPMTGQSFFDRNLGKPIWYNGTNWVDATGANVSE